MGVCIMWQVVGTQNEDAWLSDYLTDILTDPTPTLPTHDIKVGSIEASWYQVSPRVAYVATNPDSGPYGRRREIEWLIEQQLKPFGYRFARLPMSYPTPRSLKNSPGFNAIRGLPGHEFSQDVLEKAKRLINDGNVRLLRNGSDTVVSWVRGDHGTYQPEIRRDDPNSDEITGSHCQCDWGNFQNLPRTRTWKRFQDRPCAHILASHWLSRITPLDEERAPGDAGQEGQTAMPGMGGPAPFQPPVNTSPFRAPSSPGQQAIPGQMDFSDMTQPPTPAEVLPPFPGDQMQQQLPPVNPASVPGQRPGPTPTNPLQYPGGPGGGTFSSVKIAVDQAFQNGDRVQLRHPEEGILQGRSLEHGAGQKVTMPQGSVGEVLGMRNGLVNVLIMNKVFNQNVQMEPYGATVWAWPQDLIPRPDIKAPGPAIRRI